MKPTLEERIMATGQTLERVREWQSIIESIAAKSGEPKEDVASIILRPLATGKVMLADCYKLQEIGVPLSESFMKLVPLSKATSKALLHELTRLGHNSEKAKQNFYTALDYGMNLVKGEVPDNKTNAEETTALPTLPIPAHKVEIYPNAVVVDGKPLKVRKDGVTVNNVADGDNLLSVTVELMVEDVTLFPYRYGAK